MNATISLMHPREFYIDGVWVSPSSSSTFDIVNCSTEEVVTRVAEAQVDDVDRAVAAARRAFDEGPWPRLTHAERAAFLRAMAEEFQKRNDDLAAIWSIESGVTYSLAKSAVGYYVGGAFNSYADMASTFAFEEKHRSSSGLDGRLVREPVGVVGAIIPWNGPAIMMAFKCAPALLAGCTVVMKFSPEAPCSGHIMAEICEKIGLPNGVFNCLTADREVSEALVRHPDVDKITFTGSTASGRKVASICGDRIARVTLELGGKSPAVVLDDYDIEAAAKSIAGTYNFLSGQVCDSLTRIIVPRQRHDQMVEALSGIANGLKVGNAFDPDVVVGPLATSRQRDRVEGYIAKGRAEGATLAAGGKRPAHLNLGFYIEPTVFGNVDNRSTIGREEIFGPVLSVIPADSESHALELANDTIYGLNAAVFTQDTDRFLSAARKIRSGSVGHNGSRADFTIGAGGFKQSGIGREGATEGLMPFLETKVIVLDRPAEPA